MTESELLEKMEQKYERPMPGLCCVCGSNTVIDHKGGGLPLKWVCEAAVTLSDSEETREHIERSAWLDYRKLGDARVMALLRMYRALKAQMPKENTSSEAKVAVMADQ